MPIKIVYALVQPVNPLNPIRTYEVEVTNVTCIEDITTVYLKIKEDDD